LPALRERGGACHQGALDDPQLIRKGTESEEYYPLYDLRRVLQERKKSSVLCRKTVATLGLGMKRGTGKKAGSQVRRPGSRGTRPAGGKKGSSIAQEWRGRPRKDEINGCLCNPSSGWKEIKTGEEKKKGGKKKKTLLVALEPNTKNPKTKHPTKKKKNTHHKTKTTKKKKTTPTHPPDTKVKAVGPRKRYTKGEGVYLGETGSNSELLKHPWTSPF